MIWGSPLRVIGLDANCRNGDILTVIGRVMDGWTGRSSGRLMVSLFAPGFCHEVYRVIRSHHFIIVDRVQGFIIVVIANSGL